MDSISREECQRIHSDLNKSLDSLTEKIDKMPEKFENKFATKNVEKLVFTFVGMVLLSFCGSLITLVFVFSSANLRKGITHELSKLTAVITLRER